MFSLSLSLAVDIPPHGRVNQKCYPKWNHNKDSLLVAWNGTEYTLPWKFDEEVSLSSGCTSNNCVQRLFCTGTGAVGYYDKYSGGDYSILLYTYLQNTAEKRSLFLTYTGPVEKGSGKSTMTSPYGPSTVTVVGDTVYFFTVPGRTTGYPVLNSYVFANYYHGANPSDLVTRGLDGYRIIPNFWGMVNTSRSLIYPSDDHGLTISAAFPRDSMWAIDTVVSTSRFEATSVSFVHYSRPDVDSIGYASREVLTVPGFTCRSRLNEGVICYTTGKGWYTWEDGMVSMFDHELQQLSNPFILPSNLWLHTDRYGMFVPLVGAGLGPQIALTDNSLYAVERVTDDDCGHADGLVFRRRALDENMTILSSVSVGCAENFMLPWNHALEPSYAATAVKWTYATHEGYTLYIAEDISRQTYREYEIPARSCSSGYYAKGSSCLECEPGNYCDGDSSEQCPAGQYQPDKGANSCMRCPNGYYTTDSSLEQIETGASECWICPYAHACVNGTMKRCDDDQYTAAYRHGTLTRVMLGATVCMPCEDGYACDGSSMHWDHLTLQQNIYINIALYFILIVAALSLCLQSWVRIVRQRRIEEEKKRLAAHPVDQIT